MSDSESLLFDQLLSEDTLFPQDGINDFHKLLKSDNLRRVLINLSEFVLENFDSKEDSQVNRQFNNNFIADCILDYILSKIY